jgi:iron complex transport system substrate-binding protein
MRRGFAALLLLAAGCMRYAAPPPPADVVVDVDAPLATNILEGRVRRYRADLDYFPDKTTFRYSRQVSIEYGASYKVLTITPAANPNERFRYVLVQRGTPAPPVAGHARVIEVPVRTFALTHGELLGAAEIAGLADRLIAIDSTTGVREPGIRAGIEAGRIVAVGGGKHIDVERTIALRPDLVMTYWSLDPSYDAHPVLDQAGVPTVVLASHWDTAPLAVAEWMKVLAVLFNQERAINQVFDGIAGRYETLAARARRRPGQPLLLSRLPFRHIWYVRPDPALLADAGGRYFWPGEVRARGVDIEAVARRGRDADAWIIDFPTPIRTIDELLAREPRLAVFKPVRTGEVWNWDLQAVRPDLSYHDRDMRPDLVLADLVKILHPDLVPGHDFVFYRQFDPPASGSHASARP